MMNTYIDVTGEYKWSNRAIKTTRRKVNVNRRNILSDKTFTVKTSPDQRYAMRHVPQSFGWFKCIKLYYIREV